jgi:hypothetical protein
MEDLSERPGLSRAPAKADVDDDTQPRGQSVTDGRISDFSTGTLAATAEGQQAKKWGQLVPTPWKVLGEDA